MPFIDTTRYTVFPPLEPYRPIWERQRECDCWKQTAPICDECKADQVRRAELRETLATT
jgi:hypothetical protein